jgi:hypothetical protein
MDTVRSSVDIKAINGRNRKERRNGNSSLGMARKSVVALTLFMGLLCVPFHADAQIRTGSVPNFTGFESRDFDCRTSTFTVPGDPRLAEIPNTRFHFVLGGSVASSVIVTFVGNWPKPSGSDLPPGSQPAGAILFMEIDDQLVDPLRNGGVFVADTGATTRFSNGTHGFTFVTEPLPPGTHVVKFYWSNDILVGTGTVCLFERSIVVQHP